MHNFILRFQDSLKQLQLSEKTDRLLLAVSGGLDSVVLAEAFRQSGFDFGIAHANFQLRGQESERDAEFVQELAAGYGKPFLLKKFDTREYLQQHAVSVQLAARELRYAWFESLLGKGPGDFRWLVTAHQLDDNIETMLMHFFRGTGIAGLRGMLPRQGNILRPLLTFSRSEIKSFAEDLGLRWVEDSSNESDHYTRNYFRNSLIPAVETRFPAVRRNLEKNLARFAETEILYRHAVQVYKKKLLQPRGEEQYIPILLLKKTEPLHSILYEILTDFGFSAMQVPECIKLMDAANGAYLLGPSHRIIKNRAWLIIAPLEHSGQAPIILEDQQQQVIFPEGELVWKTVPSSGVPLMEKNILRARLDADNIRFPLLLRKWKAGDYFYPLGMKKKKKLARFFIDQKLSRTAKEKVWVLESDQRIIWVLGQRIDDRFSVSASTKKILDIEMRVPELR